MVTTLGAGDLHLSDELIRALNDFLSDRDDVILQTVLDRAPNPVRMAVQHYLKDKCAPEAGTFTEYGPIDIVRHAVYFSRIDDELEDYLEGAYMIGLGIRMSNKRGTDGDVDWVVQLLSDEVSVPASAEPRSWELPAEAKLLSTWTSKQLLDGHGPVHGALKAAATASAEGHWVRVHSLLHSDRDENFGGSGTSEFVVDVFDA
ncbi:hypothetical protein, partial [Kitasatospora putterlickiae]|uniref:hypothetical protein n=1 Tax=Kitasatospora putterlickiae TaxID=221725 RepID=UPI0031DC6CA3